MNRLNILTNLSSSQSGVEATLRDVIAKPIQKIRAGSGVESKKEENKTWIKKRKKHI